MIDRLKQAFDQYLTNNAFCIQEVFYTYRELKDLTAAIQQKLLPLQLKKNAIALIFVDDSIQTYASVFATWFTGMCYVPVKANNPEKRNRNILEQVQPDIVLSCSALPSYVKDYDVPVVDTGNINTGTDRLKTIEHAPDDLAYILFTSGSTGIPKGVKITYSNISTFLQNFEKIGFNLSHRDRFLQMYDLTFDASVFCMIFPMLFGGCIFTVPDKSMKYLNAYRIIRNHQLTFIKMTPSTIAFLEPYFNEILLTQVRYCLFGAEPLTKSLWDKWRKCVPHASLFNVYGPTETTINCTYYKQNDEIKAYHDIVSIGKALGDLCVLVLDEHNQICKPGQKGELCVAGNQITPGYWDNDEKNISSFFTKEVEGQKKRFYRTGDLAYTDLDGDLYFCGRLDYQIKVQGFRVELGEIEQCARELTGLKRTIAMGEEVQNQTRILLFVENYTGDIRALKTYLTNELPDYMVPWKIINIAGFPQTTSGKIDRRKLMNMTNPEPENENI